MTIAIMSAMHEENASIVQAMSVDTKEELGNRTYYSGTLDNRRVVVVFSHWGKVAASITATCLITRFGASEIVFTGVAGAVKNNLKVGDIVVGENLYQHDMDARPIIARHEIPLLGRAAIAADHTLRSNLMSASRAFLEDDFKYAVSEDVAARFALTQPRAITADIASGDQFISDPGVAADVVACLPNVACVEMEGAAVAQVCESFGVRFGVVRTISDGADESSEIDFPAFIADVAQVYSVGIIRRYLATAR